MYKSILVPTDGSPGMERIVDRASELAALDDATVHLVYVVDSSSFLSSPMENSWEGVETVLREEGEKVLQDAERRCTADKIETAILEGAPSREIVTYAARTPCDLVVMGTHGRAGLGRLLIGSVAERVVRSSTVPVMTIRLGVDDHPKSESQERRPIAVDPSVSEAIE